MRVDNYTAYSTEDIVAISDAWVAAEGAVTPARAVSRVGAKVKRLVVVYWKGRGGSDLLNVRPDCSFDPERGGLCLRIKHPHRLHASPLDMLSMGASHTLPSEVVAEVIRAIGSIRWWARSSPEEMHPDNFQVRLNADPEKVETQEEKIGRVRAKKVRKAVRAAVDAGVRSGFSVAQITDRITSLAALSEFLTPVQKELLEALTRKQDVVSDIQDITRRLERT